MRKNRKIFYSRLLLLALVFVLPVGVQAQKPKSKNAVISFAAQPVSIKDYRLNSKLMAREMPYRIVLPTNYASDQNTRFPVIYLLHGLTGHYDNWGSKTKIAEFLSPYPFIVVMPEGGDGWYTDSATQPNDRYESYVTQELIPEIDKNFRTIADRQHRIVAGLSMGGYGSIKYGLKYPEMFGLVGSFSGALGAAGWTETILTAAGIKSGAIPKSILSVYGADNSQTRRENDIFRIVKEILPEKVKTLPFIYLDCGTEDFLIQNNRDFLVLLNEKKIPHEFRELPGGHTWQYWEAQIQDFLRLSEKFFNQQKAKAA
jgi:putative tributyrin esterase